MLLVTDRSDRNRSLERTLALWSACTVLDVNAAKSPKLRRPRLIVTDIDLTEPEAIRATRIALANGEATGRPHLCLLRDSSSRAAMQANAIGATDTLPADAPVAVLREKIVAMLASAGAAPETTPLAADVGQAAAAMSDLLAAAATGGRLPLRALDESVASIGRAVEQSDLDGWLSIVRRHDDLTYQHCLLVSGLAASFGRALGFPEKDRRLLTTAAVLHDIGKARIPLAILHKPGGLSDEERAIVRLHPEFGHEMLKKQGGFHPDLLGAVLSHHEYLDGTGYPHGLRGGQIPDLVRMITICDIYAALIERRSYKPPMAGADAFAVLMQMRGKLDPALLGAFERVIALDGRG